MSTTPKRVVRHWKQVFNIEGPFVFTRSLQLEEGRCMVGDTVPDYLSSNGHRMKMWWRGNVIALKNWDYPEARPMTDEEIA